MWRRRDRFHSLPTARAGVSKTKRFDFKFRRDGIQDEDRANEIEQFLGGSGMAAVAGLGMALASRGAAVVVQSENAQRGCQGIRVRIGFVDDGAKLVNGEMFAAADIEERIPNGRLDFQARVAQARVYGAGYKAIGAASRGLRHLCALRLGPQPIVLGHSGVRPPGGPCFVQDTLAGGMIALHIAKMRAPLLHLVDAGEGKCRTVKIADAVAFDNAECLRVAEAR